MAKETTQAKQTKEKSKKPSKPSNYLSTVMSIQLGISLVGAAILLATLHFFSATQMTQDVLNTRLKILSESASTLVDQSFSSTQSQLNKLTESDDIYNALILQDMVELADLENRLVKNFNQAQSLKIIPWSETGTAGIKQMGITLRNNIETMMVTKVANHSSKTAEIYQLDKKWVISFATPIIHQDKTIGVLLLSLSNNFLKDTLSQPVFIDNGSLQVMQAKRSILTIGTPNTAFQSTIKAPFDGGLIIVSLAPKHTANLKKSFLLIYITVGIICLVFLCIPCIGYVLNNKAINNDINALKQFIKQSMGLHEGKRPKLKINAFNALCDNIISVLSEPSAVQDHSSAKNKTEDPAATFNRSAPAPAPIAEEISTFNAPHIFKEYDIRGKVSSDLGEDNVIAIGKAIGSEVLAQGGNSICVGFDARSSSSDIAIQLSKGIQSTGCDTVSIGQALSPTLYFATHKLSKGNGVMITGSHLGDDYNGFKIVIDQKTLLGPDIQNLLNRIQNNNYESGEGQATSACINNDYTQEIAADIITARGLKIIIDNHNEEATTLASQLLNENDCDIITINSNGDNPSEALAASINENNADFGIAFDSDADRLIVVSNSGKSIESDKLIMLFAQDISSRNPGSSIIYDVKCSRELGNIITQAGSRPVMHKTGHSNIKAKMAELDAIFAGEYTGHFYFKDRWYGFDDGIYAAMRLAELISSSNESLDDRLQTLPQTASSPEYVIETSSDEKKHEIVSYIANAMESQQGEKNHYRWLPYRI